MPYISSVIREEMDGFLNLGAKPIEIGVVNYLITKIINHQIKHQHESYKTYNELIGVLECAKLELYRRVVSEYENKKASENGDVY